MNTTTDRIAGRLETAFAAHGFAEPGVDALRHAAEVSLRTLYTHFPSREAMVLAALEHRHRAYLAHLGGDAPAERGDAAIRHVFQRLGAWMETRAPRGCLFVQALAAHPASGPIRDAVVRHKAETRDVLVGVVGQARPALDPTARMALADALMVVHEGLTALAASVGTSAATASALAALDAILAQETAA